MRIIPKNTKVSTEFFKGVTLADMIVGFIGVLIIFLIAISSLPSRGYIALGFGFVLVFLLVRIDDESNYMFLFRIIRHFSYYRSYQKPGFEYPEIPEEEELQEAETEQIYEVPEENTVAPEYKTVTSEAVTAALEDKTIHGLETITPGISEDISGENPVMDGQAVLTENKKEKDPLQIELEEEGFEILDLNEVSVEKKKIEKPTDAYAKMKKKAPQSVWDTIRERAQKSKKGDL